MDSADIVLELDLGAGRARSSSYELRRGDVERLTEPYMVRSVNLCQQALAEARLTPGDIARCCSSAGRRCRRTCGSGSPTGTASASRSTTARTRSPSSPGAPRSSPAPSAVPTRTGARQAGRLPVALEYPPIGPDTEPLIAGPDLRAGEGAPDDLSGYRVESSTPARGRPGAAAGSRLAPTGIFTVVAWQSGDDVTRTGSS